MDEPLVVEGTDLAIVDLRGKAEHQLQMRIGGERHSVALARKRAEIDALVGGLEQFGQRNVQISG